MLGFPEVTLGKPSVIATPKGYIFQTESKSESIGGKPTVSRAARSCAAEEFQYVLRIEDKQLTDNEQIPTLPHLYSRPQGSATLACT